MTHQPVDTVVQGLLDSDEDQLLAQLGMRSLAALGDLSQSALYAPDLGGVAPDKMGAQDELKKLGKRILKRWNQSAYQLVCGDEPDDAKTRKEVQSALGLGKAAAAGVITSALIGVGLMPALAPVVAAIVINKFFDPAYGEFCAYWKENL
jgi:hypothetical protein